MTILCYHAVDPAWRSVLSVSPEEFERHCAWLRRNRTVAPLEEIVGRMDSGGRPRRGTTALTFDDGFASVFHHAFPTLRRHGLPATMFVVAETLTPMGRAVDWVDDPPSQTLATLTREQVLEMRDAGIRFGSHSYRHADLPSLTEEECIHDLRASRELLEDLLSRPVPFLAYPRGLHDERVRRAAQRASFTHAFSLPEAREPSGPFAVPRVGVYPGNGVRGLRIKTSPWYLSLRTSRVYPAIRAVATRR